MISKFLAYFSHSKPLSLKPCFEDSVDYRPLVRGLTLAFVAMSFFPESAVAGLDHDLSSTSDLVFNKFVPLLLGLFCLGGCGYSLSKSNAMGVVVTLGGTAIAGYTLNSIQSGSFLKMLGGD